MAAATSMTFMKPSLGQVAAVVAAVVVPTPTMTVVVAAAEEDSPLTTMEQAKMFQKYTGLTSLVADWQK
jgi:hypothetical protein